MPAGSLKWIILAVMLLLAGVGVFALGQKNGWWTRPAPVAIPDKASAEAVTPASIVPLSDLPLPSQTEADEYQTLLYAFLREFRYRKFGWLHDQRVRDTGDFKKGGFNGHDYNGTHPAVVVYYSPEVIDWLHAGKKGKIPDGAMIVKEMYPPPAARYEGKKIEDLVAPWWTVMIKDQAGSHDGWYWASMFDEVNEEGERITLQPIDSQRPGHYPESGFGSYCIRCHASAQDDFTFSSLHNIEHGHDPATGEHTHFGEPIRFTDDGSWKLPVETEVKELLLQEVSLAVEAKEEAASGDEHTSGEEGIQEPAINPAFILQFPRKPPDAEKIEVFPPATGDRAHQPHGGAQFITSDQCMSCHFGDNTPYGPNLFLKEKGVDGQGHDISPHGEWRWSMMGLAGRDPVFYAQLESELEFFAEADGRFTPPVIADLCLSCHGAMGQRQFHIDHGDLKKFPLSEVTEPSRYGALARDGISCTVCHQMKDNRGQPLEEIFTGRFEVEPPQEGMNILLGPFDDPLKKPMEAGLGLRAKKSDFLSSSRLCASCHTVHLPACDIRGNDKQAGFEQATYLEWVNSDYYDSGPTPQSCQSCHMPDHFEGRPFGEEWPVKIANIQDHEFPAGLGHGDLPLQAHGLLPVKEITVPLRQRYRRHTLGGINVFTLEMFRQFPHVLGVEHHNYMNYMTNGVENSLAGAVEQAGRRTARTNILRVVRNENRLAFDVRVQNLTGHRFPTGVGFRRAFLDVAVYQGEKVLWRSGGTNEAGVIVDAAGKPLPSEFLEAETYPWHAGPLRYQPHHEVIRHQSQVQIYEELTTDEDDEFTTSFLRIFNHFKDNRLLPKGWTNELIERENIRPSFMKATHPYGGATADADFTSGAGEDIVRYEIELPENSGPGLTVAARLYYQSLPPRYLQERFQTRGPATDRLYHLASRLETEGRAIESWKLLISEDLHELPK